MNWRRIRRTALIGVASLALIIPLGMSGNSSAHIASANGADAYGDQAGEMIDNGLINTQGQWTASKHDHWLFNHNLMDSTGELDGVGEEVQDIAENNEISFMKAYHYYEYAMKRTHGNVTYGQLVRMDIHGSNKRTHHAKRHVNNRKHSNSKRTKRNRKTKRINRKHNRKNIKRNRKVRKHNKRHAKRHVHHYPKY